MYINQAYKSIVNEVLASLKEGTPCWRSGMKEFLNRRPAINFESGNCYTGLNAFMLMMKNPHYDHRYMTFNQISKKELKLKKGSRAVRVAYFSSFKPKDDPEEKKIPFLKWYSIFNLADVDGIETIEPVYKDDSVVCCSQDTIDKIQKVASETGAKIEVGINANPHHIGSTNTIHMPRIDQYSVEEQYYSALLHELVHWTKVKNRTNRVEYKLSYAMEELVAELGTLFLYSKLRLTCDFPNHASYLSCWSTLLKDTPTALMKAASYAQKAVDYLCEKSPYLASFS